MSKIKSSLFDLISLVFLNQFMGALLYVAFVAAQGEPFISLSPLQIHLLLGVISILLIIFVLMMEHRHKKLMGGKVAKWLLRIWGGAIIALVVWSAIAGYVINR